jgi:hypothetical protein
MILENMAQRIYWITWSMDMWCEVEYDNTTIARAKPLIWDTTHITQITQS